ncbi:TonB-dependent receptor [Methylocystis parvus]|uniref:TonB-dependent receptor plug domain-containing protein n=1 Tax=Methylocystis parvus TaxID=134 RepID=A0A6B8MAY0_9HYPH|nr:TonB-dependent receptor [Methylocystis parvus]QGM99861.1 TonB-dependent receptor plug domain-containing protein [Methylocystis parvus]
MMKQHLLNTSAITHFLRLGCGSLAMLTIEQSAYAQGVTPIPDITVVAPSDRAPARGQRSGQRAAARSKPTEGSEAAGYKPETATNFGPFGKKPILDIPYSVNVISAPLIQNRLAWQSDDIYKISPVIQLRTTSARGGEANFKLRGFVFANADGRAEDGMRVQNFALAPLEDKERVEIYTGLTSFLYGPANVGGLINYVYKRPTDAPLADVTVGNYGGLSAFVHGDFGGPIDKEGKFAYRLNIVGQSGDTSVDKQSIKRDVLTAALSWRPTKDLTVTGIASHADYNIRGVDPFWNFPVNADGSSSVRHPGAPDASVFYGQPFTSFTVQRDRFSLDFNWRINEIFTARASYMYTMNTTREFVYSNNNVLNTSLAYTQVTAYNRNGHEYGNSGYAFLDAAFDTGFIHHKLTAGFYGNDYRSARDPANNGTKTLTGLRYWMPPVYYAEPGWIQTGFGPTRTLTYSNNKNALIGDDIKLNEQWSLLVGGNYTWLHGTNFNNSTGAVTASYDQGRLSPTASLIFKPVEWISTYGTYSESLQSGATVSTTGVMRFTNAGQTLPPFVGRQYEVGAKADVGGMLLTAAFFQIEQALQYAQYNNDGTYTLVQDGRQRTIGV